MARFKSQSDPEVEDSVIANHNERHSAGPLRPGGSREAARPALGLWLGTATFALAVAVGCATTQEVASSSDDALPEHVLVERARLFELAFDHWMAQKIRLQRVADRLKLVGREVCGMRVSPMLGAVTVRLDRVPRVLGPVAKERFGEGEGSHVIAVFPEMAADRAGLEVGDTVLEIDDSDEREQLVLDVSRDGEQLKLTVDSDLGCADPVILVTQEEVNAYADGKAVRVYTGLVRALPDDAMLAQIVGHELGHNIKRDPSRYARTWSKHRRQEATADYIGIYLAAMAGYPIATDTEKLLGLLRDIRYFGARGSHPTTAARDLALRKTLEEIQGKQERGEVVDLSSP
jgi:hypothetical protein